jgi:hypothetical protein
MRAWMAVTMRTDFGQCIGRNTIEEALLTLDGIARFDGPERRVHLRVAEQQGAIYLDLGEDTDACVEVTSRGWRVLEKSPVLFRRPRAMRPLPRPEHGGALNELRPFVKMADEDTFLLFVAWLVAALRPDRPVPVLALQSEQGTAKTTTSRVARALVDPNAAPVRSAPRSEDDLAVAAAHSHIVAFDNLSGVPTWLSDALCRLATGGGLSKRTLFTDDQETVLDAIRPIIVNGIDDIADRADLGERCLVLPLRPIPKAERRDEQSFWKSFDRAAPRILGVLLDGVACALRDLPLVRHDELPRMADFACWIAAAEPGLGLPRGTLGRAYERNRARVVEVALDASPVATAVLKLLGEQETWEGEPGKLLGDLTAFVTEDARRTSAWPKSPRALRAAINRAASFLRTVGVSLNLDGRVGHESRRIWTLARPKATAASSGPLANGASGLLVPADSRGDREPSIDDREPNARAASAADKLRTDARPRATDDACMADGADDADGRADPTRHRAGGRARKSRAPRPEKTPATAKTASKLADATTSAKSPALPAATPGRSGREGGRAQANDRRIDQPPVPVMQTVPEAAETLRTTAEALRARLRRAQVVGADGAITSPLAQGIVGMKVGPNTWRVRFDAK